MKLELLSDVQPAFAEQPAPPRTTQKRQDSRGDAEKDRPQRELGGVGWFIYPRPKVIHHSGWTVGGLSVLTMLPETNTVVAILTNRGGLNIPEGHRLYFDIEVIGFKVARVFSQLASDSQTSGK